MICDDAAELDQEHFPVHKKSNRNTKNVEGHCESYDECQDPKLRRILKQWQKSSDSANEQMKKGEHV